jgi:hypothetical protein
MKLWGRGDPRLTAAAFGACLLLTLFYVGPRLLARENLR